MARKPKIVGVKEKKVEEKEPPNEEEYLFLLTNEVKK